MPAPRRQSAPINPLRREPAARAVALAWRRLTGGGRGRDAERRTLLACSGGADSAAMLLALAAHAQIPAALVVGHVVHDMRPRAQTHKERDRVRGLAGSLGLEFVERSVRVRGVKGNAEAVARERRYGALTAMARDAGCAYVATAHQGDDLLETVLMRLVRGAGVRGLVGIHESRPLGEGVRLIRPMLVVTRAEAEQLCRAAGWSPNDDPTNRDRKMLRSRLRHDVLPVLREVSPRVHERVLETSRLMAGMAEVLDAALLEGATAVGRASIPRDRARAVPEVALGEALRDAVRRSGGSLDKLPARAVAEACRVIRGPGTDPKTVRLPGLEVRVTAHTVVLVRSV